MKRYLDVQSLDAVHALLQKEFACKPSVTTVPVAGAAGRITASPIFVTYSVPEVHVAAMDGIAVVSD